jgi:hypothetical protein
MCAINPKHEKHFTISVYTSLEIPEEDFRELVYEMLVRTEMTLNLDMRLRWHVKEQQP